VQFGPLITAARGNYIASFWLYGAFLNVVELWTSMLMLCADMRRDIQEIFRATPHSKQVMMFSATLSRDIRPVCKKFMQDVIMSAPAGRFFFFLSALITCFHAVTAVATCGQVILWLCRNYLVARAMYQ